MIMPMLRVTFDSTDMPPKLPVGPTRSNPGPILLKVAATAENAVRKFGAFRETSSSKTTKTRI